MTNQDTLWLEQSEEKMFLPAVKAKDIQCIWQRIQGVLAHLFRRQLEYLTELCDDGLQCGLAGPRKCHQLAVVVLRHQRLNSHGAGHRAPVPWASVRDEEKQGCTF